MDLPCGIPTIANLNTLVQTDLYRRHVQFNRDFLDAHGRTLAKYGRRWGKDPFQLWSRRWEYPFAAQKLLAWAASRMNQPMKILDAGSGVTYLPFFLAGNLPQAELICCDSDPAYEPIFDEINRQRNQRPVRFVRAQLQHLPIADASLDAVCCISVLEHTDRHARIISEFARVLKPAGLLVLTFDLSLDDKFTLSKSQASELLQTLAGQFAMPDAFDPRRELDRICDNGILTTDYVRATEPHLLPWSWPVRVYKAMVDLMQGRGWTWGFRSRTIFCLDATRLAR